MDVRKGIGGAGIARGAGSFDRHVGMLGQGQQVGQVGPRRSVSAATAAPKVVHNQLNFRVTFGNLTDGR